MTERPLSLNTHKQPDLKGKIIAITGASSGIGKHTAIMAAKYGAQVLLIGKSLPKLEKVYDEIVENGYEEPAIHPIDLVKAKIEQFDDIAINFSRMFQKCDGMVHAAGTLGLISPIEHYSPHLWQETVHLNLNVPFILTQKFMPLLKAAPNASIVFLGAPEGQQGKAYWGAYSASKFGIESLKQVLHEELENTHVRVNAFNPISVNTGLRAKAYPAKDPATSYSPDEIAQYLTYLLCDETSEICGETLQPLKA